MAFKFVPVKHWLQKSTTQKLPYLCSNTQMFLLKQSHAFPHFIAIKSGIFIVIKCVRISGFWSDTTGEADVVREHEED